MEPILPEVVTTDREGYKAVSYANIVPVLVEAIKDQQKQIEILTRQVNALTKTVEKLKSKLQQ